MPTTRSSSTDCSVRPAIRERRHRRPDPQGSLMFGRFFIQRPIFSSVLSILIVLVGVVAIGALPIAVPADLAATITVSAMYRGQRTIAETVAARSRSRSTASRACST